VMTHDFKRLAALTPGATMWGSVPSWTKDLAKWIKADERLARLIARVKRHASGIFAHRRKGKTLDDIFLAHKAAPGSPIDWARALRQPKAPGPFSDYFPDEAAAVSPEAMALLDKIVRRRMRHHHPLSIAHLDKIFGPPLEVEIPLKILGRMMADIANLGK
jgi:hypothetical protein